MVLVVIPIGFILLGFYAYATNGAAHQWGEALTRWIVDISPFGSTFSKPISRWIVNGASWIGNRMGDLFVAHVQHLVNWIGGMGDFVSHFVQASLSAPLELILFARWLLTKEIPHLIHSLPSSVTKVVHGATKIIHEQGKTITRIERASVATVKAAVLQAFPGLAAATVAITWLHDHFRAITKAAAHAGSIALPWAEWPSLRREVEGAIARLRRIGWIGAFAGPLALVAVGIRRLGLEWLRCKNVSKAGKAICRTDTHWLDSLLLDGLAIVSVVSVVEFANELRGIEDEALKIAGQLISEWPSS